MRYQGYWWNAEEPENKLNGQLTYDFFTDPVAVLVVRGNAPLTSASCSGNAPAVIVGQTSDGKTLRLMDNIIVSSEVRCRKNGTKFQYDLWSNIVIMGGCINSSSDICISKLSFTLTNLHNWFNLRKQVGNELSLSAVINDLPKPIYESDDYYLSFIYSPIFAQSSKPHEHGIRIEIDFKKPVGMSAWFKVLLVIQRLFTFFMGSASYAFKLEALMPVVNNLGRKFDPKDISKLYITEQNASYVPREIMAYAMMLPYSDIMPMLCKYIARWIQMWELYEPVMEIFFMHFYRNQDSVLRFLNLTIGIEAYHRIRFGGCYQSPEEYKLNLYRRLIEVVDSDEDLEEDFKESLKKGKLLYAYEYSLRKRLRLVLEWLDSAGVNLPSLNQPKFHAQFADDVVTLRNGLVHLSVAESIRDSTTINRITQLTTGLLSVYQSVLLTELGIPPEKINWILERSSIIPLGIL